MNDTQKISIRFFDDREVRALWDEENAKWRFSVLDIIAVLTNPDDYTKTRNYCKYLKAKLKKEGSQVVSITTQLKLLAPDSKKRLSDMLDYEGIIALGKTCSSEFAIPKQCYRISNATKLVSGFSNIRTINSENKNLQIPLRRDFRISNFKHRITNIEH